MRVQNGLFTKKGVTEKLQKYQHYHQLKLINMNILQVKYICIEQKGLLKKSITI